MADEPATKWEAVSTRIHELWVERLDDYECASRGDLHDIAALVREEFALTHSEAEKSVERWKSEIRPLSLLPAQWSRFCEAMQGHWDTGEIVGEGSHDDLDAKRNLVFRHIEDLLVHMSHRYRLTESAAARQINDWLHLVRSILDRRPSRHPSPRRETPK